MSEPLTLMAVHAHPDDEASSGGILAAYADQGIRVNVVAPGPILTYHIEAAGPQAQRGAAMSTPMRRIGTTAEVAQAVLWLCSDQAAYITGAALPVDGGETA